MPQHVFFLGVTGYLGGSLLASLIQDDNYEIIALVRSQAKAHWLAAHNITPVIGDLNSLGLLEEQASLADIVINTADSDHVPSTITTLLGLQKRYKQTGKKPLYLHTRYAFHYLETDLPEFRIDQLIVGLEFSSTRRMEQEMIKYGQTQILKL